MEVLARYYISRQAYANAARVYELLAERRGGPGELAVLLEQRARSYQEAVLQVRAPVAVQYKTCSTKTCSTKTCSTKAWSAILAVPDVQY